MKVTSNNLSKYTIDKLIVVSLEQALYQALVVIDGEEHLVWEKPNKPLQSRDLRTIREYFTLLDIPEVILRHESPYDEMVGQPTKNHSNRMEVPLGNMQVNKPDYLN